MTDEHYDAIVVGAGFAGLYMLHRLRRSGFSVRVYDRAHDVGGTWYWNRYPGARCDVESMEYSYTFDEELQQEWEWTERYAGQPEILRYAEHVADRFDLRRDIQFSTEIEAAHFDDEGFWRIRTKAAAPDATNVTARFLVMATGCLSTANLPEFEGRDSFAGDTYHTGRWPHEPVDFTGQRVGVIGTGSSAIQAIPVIALEAERLVVFQRTANYSIPARNEPLDPASVAATKADYAGFRARNRLMSPGFGSTIPRTDRSVLEVSDEERESDFEQRWQVGGFGFLSGFNDYLLTQEANQTAADFVRRKIAEIVHDPETARLLTPQQVIGCKRLCLDTGYFETFNRENVKLVDVSSTPIERITPQGVIVGDEEHPLDALVFATGFDAMTGALLGIDIRGRGGLTLGEKWAAGPRTYLGLCTEGFPNLFTISGPGSPSVLTNMIVSIEQHVEWIADCLEFLRDRTITSIEATREAENAWVAHVNALADATLYPSCNSWYLGANIPGKPRVFMPHLGFPPYVKKCDQVAANDYEGFVLERR